VYSFFVCNGRSGKKLQCAFNFSLYFRVSIGANAPISRGAFFTKAEIIPVEPEQGNACEGKVSQLLFVSLLSAFFPVLNFEFLKKDAMKKFLGAMFTFCFVLSLNAQFTIKGSVIDHKTKLPVEAVSISVLKDKLVIANSISGNNGLFEIRLKSAGSYEVVAQHLSMQKSVDNILVQEPATTLNIEMEQASYFLEPLEVKAVRAGDKSPFTKTNLDKQYIENLNLGRDLPFILDQTPSVVVNSDAGNGVGYTGIRIRGSDASRVNVTMNGIPYNDAESQGTFFVDMPDIASSLNSIQVQRGVGTSSNGAGAFGATINLSTNEFNDQPYGEFNNSYGSFNTWKNTVKAGSGLLNNHFTVDARLSRLSSDGYIDRASTNLHSFFFSTAYVNAKTSVRLNIISGEEKTYQAWNGVPESLLKTNRTYNSSGTEKAGEPYDNETDNYQQDHYQLFLNHSFNSKLSFNTALFLTRGQGYYEQYKAGESFDDYGLNSPIFGNDTIGSTDLVRQLWLDNYYYGQIFSLQYKANKHQLTFGGGWNRYDGNHYGNIIWAELGIPKDYRYYDLDALKTDVNFYAKWQFPISNKLQAFADLQYRNVHHRMDGFRNNPTVRVNRNFNFVNPKAGLTYTNNAWQAYISYAMGNKEPNRDDFEAGIAQQPKYETLHNIEVGAEKRRQDYSYGANVYYMNYHNQLVLTGRVNDVGAYTRENIPQSYRLGLELQGAAKLSSLINVAGNVAFSKNKIKNFTEFVDDYDTGKQLKIVHNKSDISFSPSIVGSGTVNILPCKNAAISLVSKYVSRQYLDNTQDKKRSLNPYSLQDVRLTYTVVDKIFKEWKIIAQVNNVFNKMYEPNGYTFSYIYNGEQTTENYYFPMAGANYMIGLNVKL
jgi:iron complex outermembrane receptor protein